MIDWASGWEIWVGLATSLIATFFALLAWERKPAARLPIVLVGIAAVTIVLLGPVPRWQAEGAQESPTDPNAALTVENELRKTMATILAGVFVLGSGILAWMNIRVAQANLDVAQSNAAITAQGHITDRFTKAIEQLGATIDGNPHLEVRLGGIYALERIARDSVERDHAVIMEVLTAYVRENAPAPAEPTPRDSDGKLVIPKPRTDIQAILTVLGRRKEEQRSRQSQSLDLRATDLRGFDLTEAHLEGANLDEAHLEGANLDEAHLEGAVLDGAHLEDAYLGGAHLEGAILRSAHLESAILSGAHLEGATVYDAHLEGAYLSGAHLEGAYLSGAHLEGAYLSGAHLEGAYLSGAHLEGAYLSGAHLEGAYLSGAHLEGAFLNGAHLDGAYLGGANLVGADLKYAGLEGANLRQARLEGADLKDAKGLTQQQIDSTFTDEKTGIPIATDPTTGELLRRSSRRFE